jgi:hypothetical protein
MTQFHEDFSDEETALVEAFGGFGSCVMTCNCGRHYFVTSDRHGEYDDGELDELRANAEKDPEHYIEEGRYSYVSVVRLDGREFAPQCACKGVEKYINWMEDNLEQLAVYVATRLARKAEIASAAADRDNELLQTLRDARMLLDAAWHKAPDGSVKRMLDDLRGRGPIPF